MTSARREPSLTAAVVLLLLVGGGAIVAAVLVSPLYDLLRIWLSE